MERGRVIQVPVKAGAVLESLKQNLSLTGFTTTVQDSNLIRIFFNVIDS